MFRLALASGISRRSAFLAWLGAAFSVPFLVYSASPFPEVSGAFFATAAAYFLWSPRLTRPAAAMAALCLVAMVAAKTRLFLLVPPLATGFMRRFTWTNLTLTLGALGAAAAVASVYDAMFLSGHIVWQARRGGFLQAVAWFLNWTIWAPLQYRGHLGLLFDQEFGLLVTAPVFALALAGIVVALAQRRWRLVLLAGGPFAVAWYYLGAAGLGGMSAGGISQWYGGFSPPARFLMASLPLLTILGALALDHVRGRLGWSVTAALFALTLGYGAIISVWPAWRFQHGLGRAVALLAVFDRLGLDPGRWLPTFIAPGAGWDWPALALLVLTLAAGYLVAFRPGRDAPRGAWLTGATAAVLCAGILIGGTWIHPAGAYPAVLGTGRGGSTFWGRLDVSAGSEVATRERLVWATQGEGVLELAPRLGPGHYRVAVRAGAQGADFGPSLALQLGTDSPAARGPRERGATPLAGARIRVRRPVAGRPAPDPSRARTCLAAGAGAACLRRRRRDPAPAPLIPPDGRTGGRAGGPTGDDGEREIATEENPSGRPGGTAGRLTGPRRRRRPTATHARRASHAVRTTARASATSAAPRASSGCVSASHTAPATRPFSARLTRTFDTGSGLAFTARRVVAFAAWVAKVAPPSRRKASTSPAGESSPSTRLARIAPPTGRIRVWIASHRESITGILSARNSTQNSTPEIPSTTGSASTPSEAQAGPR